MKGTIQTQKAQVIMLPTGKASNITTALHYQNRIRHVHNNYTCKPEDEQFQHLYFISDELIKEGDLVISTFDKWAGTNKDLLPQLGKILKIDEEGYLIDAFDGDTDNRWCEGHSKKVIATTNPDLWSKTAIEGQEGHFLNKPLPKINIFFIEAYVKKQGKIDKVLLEYEKGKYYEHESCGETNGGFTADILKLKLNGSVIVHKVKSEDSIQSILNYMAENKYNETNPVLYAYVASYIK